MSLIRKIVFLASIILPSTIMAMEEQATVNDHNNYQEFLNLYGANETIINITGEEFEKFSKSFGQTTEIIPLKEGGAFIEGWKKMKK